MVIIVRFIIFAIVLIICIARPILLIFPLTFISIYLLLKYHDKFNKGYLYTIHGFVEGNSCIVYLYKDKIVLDNKKIIPLDRVIFSETTERHNDIYGGMGYHVDHATYFLDIHCLNKNNQKELLIISSKINGHRQYKTYKKFSRELNRLTKHKNS